LYQTILGAWPWQNGRKQTGKDYVERISSRSKPFDEAKVNRAGQFPTLNHESGQRCPAIMRPGPRGQGEPFHDSLRSLYPEYRYFGEGESLGHRLCCKAPVPEFPTLSRPTTSGEKLSLSTRTTGGRRTEIREHGLPMRCSRCRARGPGAVCREGAGQPRRRPSQALDHATARSQLRRRNNAIFRGGVRPARSQGTATKRDRAFFAGIASDRMCAGLSPALRCTRCADKGAELPLGEPGG